MKPYEIKKYFKENGLRIETVSFYTDLDDSGSTIETVDSNFGRCDLSGERGSVASCVCLTTEG